MQGIMDAYFMEDGELILVDYKTDKVRKGEEQSSLQNGTETRFWIMLRRFHGQQESQ